MASQGLQELASLLPGGTYITFTVLAQLTTSGANMTARMMEPDCDCSNKKDSCDSYYVCGPGYWEMSVALLIITATIVFVLAWYGEDLKSKKTQAAANAKFTAKLAAMSAAELRRKYAELVIQQVIRSCGGVGIFMVLALFTPPVSTCLLPPCGLPPVVVAVVPLLVSFAVSAFVTVKDKFVHRLVFAFDWWMHPEDREPGRWSVLTTGVKMNREIATEGVV
ncbi:hypothetical protein OEZ86_004211 [Tetradesmus obliquus]|nr:hypothetical protein OEZ86_004211 [Tetradesmus obliquus]